MAVRPATALRVLTRKRLSQWKNLFLTIQETSFSAISGKSGNYVTYLTWRLLCYFSTNNEFKTFSFPSFLSRNTINSSHPIKIQMTVSRDKKDLTKQIKLLYDLTKFKKKIVEQFFSLLFKKEWINTRTESFLRDNRPVSIWQILHI